MKLSGYGGFHFGFGVCQSRELVAFVARACNGVADFVEVLG